MTKNYRSFGSFFLAILNMESQIILLGVTPKGVKYYTQWCNKLHLVTTLIKLLPLCAQDSAKCGLQIYLLLTSGSQIVTSSIKQYVQSDLTQHLHFNIGNVIVQYIRQYTDNMPISVYKLIKIYTNSAENKTEINCIPILVTVVTLLGTFLTTYTKIVVFNTQQKSTYATFKKNIATV